MTHGPSNYVWTWRPLSVMWARSQCVVHRKWRTSMTSIGMFHVFSRRGAGFCECVYMLLLAETKKKTKRDKGPLTVVSSIIFPFFLCCRHGPPRRDWADGQWHVCELQQCQQIRTKKLDLLVYSISLLWNEVWTSRHKDDEKLKWLVFHQKVSYKLRNMNYFSKFIIRDKISHLS